MIYILLTSAIQRLFKYLQNFSKPDEPTNEREEFPRESDLHPTLRTQSALSTSMPQIAPPADNHPVVMRQKSSAHDQTHRASMTTDLHVSKSYGRLNGDAPNQQQSWTSLRSAAQNAVTSYKEKSAGKFGKMFKMWKS